MKKNIYFMYFMFCTIFSMQAKAQQLDSLTTTNVSKEAEESITAGFLDGGVGPMGIDYSSFKLPPLGTLFDNASQTPSIQLLEKERQLAKKLLTKEKRKFLEFFRVHGNYSYGNTTSTSTTTDISTPLYSFASGYESSYWNVGASVNIGLESLMDLKGKINRGRIEVEKAEIKKEIELDKLKQQIATIYVRVTNNLIALKTAAEYAASYRGAGMMTEQRFRNNQIDIKELADVRRLENDAIETYQDIQAQISTDIIMLEILTHTPIITQLTIDNP